MAIYKGNTGFSKVYLGNTQMQKIYKGSQLFYSGAKSYSEILADGNTAGWYDFDDSNTLFKNASNYVAGWGDKLSYTEGPELVDQANWNNLNYYSVHQANWSVVGGVLHSNGTSGLLTKTNFWQIGHTYKITTTIVFTSGEIRPANDNGNANRVFGPAGTSTFTYFITPGSTSLYQYSNAYLGDITGISIKEVPVNTLIQLNFVNGYQPLHSANGILFDGVNDFMKTAPFQLVQPEFIYIVIKQVSYTSTDWLFDGNVLTYGGMRQFAGTPYVQVCGGAYSSLINTFAVGSFAVIRLLFKGTDSKLIVNSGAPITGNFGTSSMGGFTLGANGSVAQFSNIQVKEIIIRKVADNSGDETILYNYLKTKYGL